MYAFDFFTFVTCPYVLNVLHVLDVLHALHVCLWLIHMCYMSLRVEFVTYHMCWICYMCWRVNVLHVLNIFSLFTCVTCPYSGMFVVKLCCLSHAEQDGLMSVLVGTVAPFVFVLCGFLPCRCDSLRYANVLSRRLSPLSPFFFPSS